MYVSDESKKIKKHEDFLNGLRAKSISSLLVGDADDEKWGSGLADYLLMCYDYTNTKAGMRFNLDGFKPRVYIAGGGNFWAD